MPDKIKISRNSGSKSAVFSVIAFCCPGLFTGMIVFLASSQGSALNEGFFGRFYTAGAVLMLGFYGAIGWAWFSSDSPSRSLPALAGRNRRGFPIWRSIRTS